MSYFLMALADEAQAVCDWISTRLGYPMTATTESGVGTHVSVVIDAYCTVTTRFDGAAWAVVADEVTTPLLPELRAAFPDFDIPDAAPLPDSWYPPFVP